MDAPGFSGGDAFRLALMDEFPLNLADQAEDLENKIRDKSAHQVFILPGIQQGHFDDENVDFLFFGQDPPLLPDFVSVKLETYRITKSDLVF